MCAGGEIADLARISAAGDQGRDVGPRRPPEPHGHARCHRAGEEGGLIEALPSDGVAILNQDDRRVRRMADRTAARVLTYGLSQDADVSADDVASAGFEA